MNQSNIPSPSPTAVLLVLCAVLASCDKSAPKFSNANEGVASQVSFDEAPAPSAAKIAMEEAEAEPAMERAKEERAGGGGKADKAGKDGKKGATTWKRSQIVANTSRLKIGDDRELPIRGIEARVQVDGFRARVLLDYYFENTDSQQYEGNFTVRLPPGASPYFLAFGQSKHDLTALKTQRKLTDKGGKIAWEPEEVMLRREANWIEPKQARVVPKEKAAFAFAETVRRKVDPALMEWAGPGMFNAKLFPIAPNKVHRVVIGYDANLTPVGDGYEFQLPLPNAGDSTQVHVAVAKAKGMSVTVEPKAEPDDSPGTQYFTYTNPDKRLITVRLNQLAAAQLTGTDEIGPYFATQFVPTLPTADSSTKSRDALFLVDTSLSANPDRFNIWLKLMKAVLEKNRATLPKFSVVFFNVESFEFRKGWLENTPANVSALGQFANTLALEGATDLGQALDHVNNTNLLKGRNADVFLMSDGAVTWGDSERYGLTQRLTEADHPVFAYRTGMSGDDTKMMEHFARETGGAVFSVVGESEIATAAVAHTQPPWTIRGLSGEGATDLLLAGRPKTLFPGQRLTVVGRGAPTAGFSLELARGAERHTVRVDVPHQFASTLTSRAYGQIAVGQLEEFLGSTRKYAEAYARHYRVPGASSSLLMLESEADYQRFDIVPKDDATVVRTNLAYDRVMTALDELVQKLGDPKAAFIAWLDHARELPGVMLNPSKDVEAMVKALPKDAFVVQQARLTAERHDRATIPSLLAEQLSIQKPLYDDVVAEAARRQKKFGNADALKALSSLVEANPGDTVLTRDVGYSAAVWGFPRQAFHLFRRVAEARPYEPQTYHAMANALASSGKPDLALVYYEVALSGAWDSRFGEFQRIVELDYLGFLRRTPASKFHKSARAQVAKRKKYLQNSVNLDGADVVVVISWNTDRTDIDLHVIEPSGEECYYSHPRTRSGGQLTRDVTTGYGPEMYVLRKAPKGKYQVRAKYYATDSNRAGTRTKVDATVYQNWGRKNQKVTRKVVTLESGKEMHDILTFKP